MAIETLIIGPHPDDECIGAGGYLAKLKRESKRIGWLLCTSPESYTSLDSLMMRLKRQEIEKCCEFFTFDFHRELKFEASRLDNRNLAELILEFKTVIDATKPQEILIPWRGDAHSDHRIIFEAAISAAKPFRNLFLRTIRCYEVISESDQFGHDYFNPNHFVDISAYIEQKLMACSIYQTEFDAHPFPRSIDHVRAKALVRGSQIGTKFAEAFVTLFAKEV